MIENAVGKLCVIICGELIDITSMNTRTSKQGRATINIAFDIKSKEELGSLVEKIRQVESVLDIGRTTG